MGCNCSLTEKIIGILVIVFAWWNLGGYSNWILTVIGAVLIIHALKCKACNSAQGTAPVKKAVIAKKPVAKKKKKK